MLIDISLSFFKVFRRTNLIFEMEEQTKTIVPTLPAILAFLRWMDRMESWNGRNFPTSLNQLAKRNIEGDLFSWSAELGNPIELPQIKKFPRAEKYRSEQIKKKLMYRENVSKKQDNAVKIESSQLKQSKNPSTQKPLAEFYKSNVWLPPPKPVTTMKSKSAQVYSGVRNNGKPTPFSVHAKQGFKYWPDELRKSKKHPTKYSFGERYNPGRAGVITDRIYSKPRTNYHYWAEFEQHQNPIGSGNFVIKTAIKR